MCGSRRSAGSGPLKGRMLSNATLTAWTKPCQRKGRPGQNNAARPANVTKEKRNENQIDQRVRG